MELIRGRQNISCTAKPSVVSIGNFDGVHLGHLQLIKTLKTKAHSAGAPATVLTFDPHPHEFFNATTAPPRLSTFRQKLESNVPEQSILTLASGNVGLAVSQT